MGIQHNFLTFNYRIVRKNRKTIGIKIIDGGEVVITSPFGVSEETILDIVKTKEKWIEDKVRLMKQISAFSKKEIKNGSKFWFLGKELELEIIDCQNIIGSSRIQNEKISIFVNPVNVEKNEVIIGEIIKLYKREATIILNRRTDIFSKIIGIAPKKIFIKDQKTLWGSCSSKKNINYNYRIIMAPIEIVDYVVVHELCHLIHMNHSQKYWSVVKSILPDYEKRRLWLKVNGGMLKIV
jgi:predicted metal-dependent hydrolase